MIISNKHTQLLRAWIDLLALLLSALASQAIAQTSTGKRVALVIGNADYAHMPKLGLNPINDVDDIGAALTNFGFRVATLKNASRDQMLVALSQLSGEAAGAEAVLVYFAGHGMQINGRNYLIPVNTNPANEDAVIDNSVGLDRVLDQIERAAVKIVMLDACRDNPVSGRFRSGQRGLAPSNPPSGTVLAFAAEAGKTASNGRGRNGIFSEALLKAFQGNDLSLGGVLRLASHEVELATGKQQTPYVNMPMTLQDRFHFSITINPGQAQTEQVFWNSIKGSTDAADFEAYLAQYPQGAFRALAENAIRRLKAARAAQAVPVPPPPPKVTPAGKPVPVPAAPPTPAVAAAPQPGQTIKDCDACPELVVLPTGRYWRGSTQAEQDTVVTEGLPRNYADREKPRVEVTVDHSLAVGKYEVTRAELARFVSATQYRTEAERGDGCIVLGQNGQSAKQATANWRNPGFAQADTHPVVCVSWNDAQAYLSWLNQQQPGMAYRLLTEAEWEYAARGRTQTRYPWGDDAKYSDICRYANGGDASAKSGVSGWQWIATNCDDRYAYTAPRGSYAANPWGLHDMHGNAWEWVQDCFKDNYNGAPVDGRAVEEAACSQRVLRGGSWNDSPQFSRSAIRGRNAADVRADVTGFRVARTL